MYIASIYNSLNRTTKSFNINWGQFLVSLWICNYVFLSLSYRLHLCVWAANEWEFLWIKKRVFFSTRKCGTEKIIKSVWFFLLLLSIYVAECVTGYTQKLFVLMGSWFLKLLPNISRKAFARKGRRWTP